MNYKIFDINLSTLDKKETINFISDWLKNNEKGFISTVNPEFLLLSKRDEEFKNILNKSKLNTVDGIGIIWASWLIEYLKIKNLKLKILKYIFGVISLIFFFFNKNKFKTIIKERVAGSELFWDIINITKEQNKKIFLLGGNSNEQLEIVINKVDDRCICHIDNDIYRHDDIHNYIFSDIGFNKGELITDENINNKLIEKINNSGAEIVFVAFGAPKQEKWINANLDKLINMKLAIGVGGTFDFISGYKKRAPKIFIKLGLEWFFRLIIEPSRWRRIFNAIIKFPIEIIKSIK